MSLKIDIITAFPAMFTGFLAESLMARALAQGTLQIVVHDLRDYSDDAVHRTIDDAPFGGGGGMILKAEPIARAVETLRGTGNGTGTSVCIIPTPHGALFDQQAADSLAARDRLIMVCGHYTGIDERVFDALQPLRLCIGDYVLSGGELPAMMISEAVARRLPGFLRNDDSASGDSFVRSDGGLGAPQYTRPAEWRGLAVPDVLLSGHHAQVAAWRQAQARELTRRYRPDLLTPCSRTTTAVSAEAARRRDTEGPGESDYDIGGEG